MLAYNKVFIDISLQALYIFACLRQGKFKNTANYVLSSIFVPYS